MTEDATLTDFLEDDGPGDDGDAERGSEDGVGPDPSTDDDGSTAADHEVEPPTPTAAWGTHVCRDCGSSARRVWRDGEGYVCPECKSW